MLLSPQSATQISPKRQSRLGDPAADCLTSHLESSEIQSDKTVDGTNAAADQQRRVDARFLAESSYWKEVYEREGVYEAIYQQRRDVVLALFDRLKVPTHSSLLEIGCGAGLTTVALARRGYVVHAIDTVNAMLGLTRQLALKAGVDQHVITSASDVCRLAFPNDTFSVVLAIGLTPWLHTLRDSLREIARVLRPGGYVIISADHRWRLNYMLDPRRFPGLAGIRWKVRDFLEGCGLRESDPARPHVHMYSSKEFDAQLRAAGLEKQEARSLGFGPFTFFNRRVLPESLGMKVHYKLQRLADRGFPLLRSAGSQYVVLARNVG